MFVEVGSSSGAEPSRHRAHLLLVAGPGGRAPSLGALSRDASVTLLGVTIKPLWKEWEDALGAIEDARREVEEERLAAATTETLHDVA